MSNPEWMYVLDLIFQTNDNEEDFAVMKHPANRPTLTSMYQPALDQPAGVRVFVVHPTTDAQQASSEKQSCGKDRLHVEVQVGTIGWQSFSFALCCLTLNVVIRLSIYIYFLHSDFWITRKWTEWCRCYWWRYWIGCIHKDRLVVNICLSIYGWINLFNFELATSVKACINHHTIEG